MADIDIDKMLEKKDREEAGKKQQAAMKKALIAGGLGVVAAAIILVIVLIMIGEKSLVYFPLSEGVKYIYNRKNKSPEEWQVLKKKDMVGEYECSVLNKVDQSNYFSTQEYYSVGGKGIILLATSSDYGKKTGAKMRLMPYRIKDGIEFAAGSLKNTAITGMVLGREEMSTPVGDVQAYKIEYRAGSLMDREVWYAKGVGIIKVIDRISGDELTLINRVEK
jgi:hypothetical protein